MSSYSCSCISAGGSSSLDIVSNTIRAGDITFPNTLGAWALLPDIPELLIPAVSGDRISVGIHGLRSASASAFFDIVVVTGGGPTIVRYLTTDTNVPPPSDAPGFYANVAFVPMNGPRSITATPADIDTGNVRFAVACNSAGADTLFAGAAYPFYWETINYGQ